MLGFVAEVLLIDHDVRATDFQQVPYHRIFIMLFQELNAPDQILETINFQVLTAYCNMLSILKPAKVAPGFAYACLKNRAPVSFLSGLGTNLQNTNAADAGMRYNISMINAHVMYVGTQDNQFIRAKGHSPSMSSIAHSSHMDIFQNLAMDIRVCQLVMETNFF